MRFSGERIGNKLLNVLKQQTGLTGRVLPVICRWSHNIELVIGSVPLILIKIKMKFFQAG